jgi:hypothetical protein
LSGVGICGDKVGEVDVEVCEKGNTFSSKTTSREIYMQFVGT